MRRALKVVDEAVEGVLVLLLLHAALAPVVRHQLLRLGPWHMGLLCSRRPQLDGVLYAWISQQKPDHG